MIASVPFVQKTFDRFPRANTPKIYRITAEELTEHLKESVPLKCDGHTIGSSWKTNTGRDTYSADNWKIFEQ